MKLEIQVTEKYCHPHLGGEEVIATSFTDLQEAEEFYNHKRDSAGDYGFVFIQIIQRRQP